MTIEHIIPAGFEAIERDWKFSPAVKAERLVIVSGQIGMTEDGGAFADPLADARAAFASLVHVLESAGAAPKDVVELVSYHTDLRGDLAEFQQAKGEIFVSDFPAWTAIGVSQLAVEGVRFEVKATAILPEPDA